jgi:hypothetical protein
VEKLLPIFGPCEDRNEQRAARLTSTRHVNSERIDVWLPSLMCDPSIVKDSKITFALTYRDFKKLPSKSYSLIT